MVGGIWNLRGVANEIRGLMGDAAPAAATFSPGVLLATGLAVVAGIGLMALATLAVILRLVL